MPPAPTERLRRLTLATFAVLTVIAVAVSGNPARVTRAYPACSPTTTTVGADTIVTFTSTSWCDWMVPAGVSTLSVLAVGGGGGGGGDGGDGGGGGEMRQLTNATLGASTVMSLQVGAGGVGGRWSTGLHGTDGGASSLAWSGTNQVVASGGLGGSNFNLSGGNQGVGGTGGTGGTGFNGGNGGSNASYGLQGNNGSNGNVSSLSGSSVTYGGGGGGGICPSSQSAASIPGRLGGAGGGGAGASHVTNIGDSLGQAGTTGLGGGGGAGSSCNGATETFGPSNNEVARLLPGQQGGDGVIVVVYGTPVPTTSTTTTTTAPSTTTTIPTFTSTSIAPPATTQPLTASTRPRAFASPPTSTARTSPLTTTTTSATASVASSTTTVVARSTIPPTSPPGDSQGAVIPSMPAVDDPLAEPQRFFSLQISSSSTSSAAAVSNGRATGTASGLLPGTVVTVTLHSDPVVLGNVTADADGRAFFDFALPPEVETGNHAVIVDSRTDNGEQVSAVATFEVTAAGEITRVTEASEILGATVDQSMVDRSVTTGLPVYDPGRHAVRTAAMLTTAVVTASAVLAATGSATATGSSAPLSRQSERMDRSGRRFARREDEPEDEDDSNTELGPDDESERDENSEGSFSSTDVNLLDEADTARTGRGDAWVTWRLPGHHSVQTVVNRLSASLGRRSHIVARALQDGHWVRAVFGSADAVLWLSGAALGMVGAYSGNGLVVAPGAAVLASIISLSILDALAGVVAWIGFAAVAVASGHVTSLIDIRTLIGLGIAFWALPSIASAIRPVRRDVNEGRFARFDRIADYALVPLFLPYASVGVVMSLNGLAGLETVTSSSAHMVRMCVFVMAFVRLAAEDVARVHFPSRMRHTRVNIPDSAGAKSHLLSVLVAAVLYVMGAAPFFGLGWRTWTVVALMSAVPLLRTVQEHLPNLPRVHRWFPRGILRTVAMIFFSAWFARAVLSWADSPQHARSLSVLLLVPAVALGLVDVLAREGGEWDSTPLTKSAGALLWLVSALVLTGVITP